MLLYRLIMIGIIIATGVLVSFKGGVISYSLFSLALLIPLTSVVYLFYVFFRFRIYQFVDRKTVVKCQQVPYVFTLANEDFITYSCVRVTFLTDFSTYEHVDSDKKYCLSSGERINHETMISCKYRGEYAIGIDKVIISDFLNLFHLTYACPSKINVRVLPRIVQLDTLSIAPAEEDMKLNKRNPGGSSLVPDNEVRQYYNGDPLNRIHWKSTAKSQKLMVRNFMAEPKPSITLFLDSSLPSLSEKDAIVYSDKVIECALAISNYLLIHKNEYTVFYEKRNLIRQPIRNKSDFDLFYNTCCQLPFQKQEAGSTLLSSGLALLENPSHCLFVTAAPSDALSIVCNEAVNYGHTMTILAVGTSAASFLRLLDKKIGFFLLKPDQEVTDVLS